MLLVIDVGNSSVSCGVFELDARNGSRELVYDFKIATKNMSSDEYALTISSFLQFRNIFSSTSVAMPNISSAKFVDCAAIASVVPGLTDALVRASIQLTGKPPFIVEPGVKTGLSIRINTPQELGADIVANAVFAITAVSSPVAILDVGTATTLTVVDRNKCVLGSIIMPGLRVSLAALSGSAAQLSEVDLAFPDEIIGRNSVESVQSGVLRGHVLMIDGFLRNIREQYPHLTSADKLSLVSTGGLVDCVIPHLRNKFTNYPSMTLQGIALLYSMNCIRSQNFV